MRFSLQIPSFCYLVGSDPLLLCAKYSVCGLVYVCVCVCVCVCANLLYVVYCVYEGLCLCVCVCVCDCVSISVCWGSEKIVDAHQFFKTVSQKKPMGTNLCIA